MGKLRRLNPEEGYDAPVQTNYQEVMKEVFPQHVPRFESPEDLLRRRKLIEGFMRQHLRTSPLQGSQKHAVVTHSMLMAAMTAEGTDDTDDKGLKGYTWAANC